MAEPNYKPLYAILATVLLVATLFSPVDSLSAQGVKFIDTELQSSEGSRLFVETKYPIGDVEKLNSFPKQFGKWRMSYQYDWDDIAELLDTDVLLSRNYVAPGVYVPVSLLIVQSTNVSSFHPAPVCYKFQGFEIADEYTSTVQVAVNNSTWAREAWLEPDSRTFQGNITVKRLMAEKELPSGAVRRELNLYFYIKEEHKLVTDRVAWIRISMYVPTVGTYERHEALLADFAGEVVPELFDPAAAPKPKLVAEMLYDKVRGA